MTLANPNYSSNSFDRNASAVFNRFRWYQKCVSSSRELHPRHLYVTSKKLCHPNKLWNLNKTIYGLGLVGLLWHLIINRWLTEDGFIEIPGLPQLFMQCEELGYPCTLIAKIVDDLLIIGLPSSINTVIDNTQKRLNVGIVIRDT